MENAFIIHGTEGYPEENWFPWLKSELESLGYKVIVPHFPSPPEIPAKIDEWFEVLKKHEEQINAETLIIGHSLGGLFALRILETFKKRIKLAAFVGTPIGIKPILNYERDSAFCGFDFDWEKIKNNSENFIVFHSDNDPYVDLANGKELAKNLETNLNFVPNAGHFNTSAGYTDFPKLLEKIKTYL